MDFPTKEKLIIIILLTLFQHLAKTNSWLYNKSTLSLFILNFFKAIVFNRIICKYSISPLLVTAVYLCNFCLLIQPAWSQQVRPRAVVIGLNNTSTPDVSEQILLQKFREKLAYTSLRALQPHTAHCLCLW